MKTSAIGVFLRRRVRPLMKKVSEMAQSWVRDNRVACLLAVLYLVVGTAYNLADPLFEPPDELLHWNYVQFLRRERSLPVVDLAGPETEYHQPPLYYAVAALFSLPEGDLAAHTVRNPFWAYDIRSVGKDNKNQYLHDPHRGLLSDSTTRSVCLTRVLSTLFGCSTALLSYALARHFLPKPLALAAMSVVAFAPNFLLTTSAITNDSLAILLSVAAGLAAVRLVGRTFEPPLRAWVGLGALLGLGLVTKVSAWPLLPTAALSIALLALRLRSWRVFWIASSTLAACVALLGAWWPVRNLVLYQDLTGMSSMWAVWGVRPPLTWSAFMAWLGGLRVSFWANFGYGNIPLPGYVYNLVDVFVVGGAAGLLLSLVRSRGRPRDSVQRDRVVILLLWVTSTFGALIWYLLKTLAVTGRQLFTILPIVAIGLCAGWGQLVPLRCRKGLAALITALMLLFGVGAWACALLPAYRPAPRLLPKLADEVIGHRLDWEMGDVARLLGCDISPDAVSGGGTADVTLYWLPLRYPDRNYTLFVHLMGVNGERVGERNTYPGLGTDATIYWAPGEVIVDTIPVPIAADAQGPVLLDVEAGLYDLQTMERLPIMDAAGNAVARPVTGRLKLLGNASAQVPSHPLSLPFQGGLELSGYDLSPTLAEPGSTITLTLYWSPAGPLPQDYTVFVHLLDAADTIVAQADGLPCNGRYPSSAWAAGERLVDVHQIALPPDLRPADYRIMVGLYDAQSMVRLGLLDGTDSVRLESKLSVPR